MLRISVVSNHSPLPIVPEARSVSDNVGVFSRISLCQKLLAINFLGIQGSDNKPNRGLVDLVRSHLRENIKMMLNRTYNYTYVSDILMSLQNEDHEGGSTDASEVEGRRVCRTQSLFFTLSKKALATLFHVVWVPAQPPSATCWKRIQARWTVAPNHLELSSSFKVYSYALFSQAGSCELDRKIRTL